MCARARARAGARGRAYERERERERVGEKSGKRRGRRGSSVRGSRFEGRERRGKVEGKVDSARGTQSLQTPRRILERTVGRWHRRGEFDDGGTTGRASGWQEGRVEDVARALGFAY